MTRRELIFIYKSIQIVSQKYKAGANASRHAREISPQGVGKQGGTFTTMASLVNFGQAAERIRPRKFTLDAACDLAPY